MSFLDGSFSALRFTTASNIPFSDEDVGKLANHSIHKAQPDAEGGTVGWCGGLHIHDGELTCDKNLRGEFLTFDFRVSKVAYPADELKAQYHIELRAAMDAAGVDRPSARMKREAKEAAADRLAQEAKDGRHTRHTIIPVVWDGEAGQVWYGSTSHANVPLFADLFRRTFGVELQPLTAGSFAGRDEIEPSLLSEVPVWIPDEQSNDWLGNEFGLWAIHRHEASQGDLPYVPTSKLVLACPYGNRGSDTFAQEFPTALPEAHKALQEGKLPRTVGLALVGVDEEPVRLTLQLERWAVSGCKVASDYDTPDGPQRDVARLEAVRSVFASLDGLMREFVGVRTGGEYGWAEVRDDITFWIGQKTEVAK